MSNNFSKAVKNANEKIYRKDTAIKFNFVANKDEEKRREKDQERSGIRGVDNRGRGVAYKEQLWPNTEIIILFKFNCELYLYGKSRSSVEWGHLRGIITMYWSWPKGEPNWSN